MKAILKSNLSLFITIGLAIVVAIVLVKTKPDMQHVATEMPSKAVEVILLAISRSAHESQHTATSNQRSH